MANSAQRSDWQNTPLPVKHGHLSVDLAPFTAEEFARLTNGHVPQGAVDHWFMFWETPWFYIHRSSTGCCIFQVRVEPDGEQYRVFEVLVNRRISEHAELSDERDALVVSVLLANQALRDVDRMWERYAEQKKAEEPKADVGDGAAAFLKGGCGCLAGVLVLAFLVALLGARVHFDLGGLICLFVGGGIVGLIVLAGYNKGRRDGGER